MTNEKAKYIFEAIEKAEVSFTDFSRLTKISRETLYRWRNGSPISDMLRLDLAYTVATRFEKACRSGKLPLTSRLKKEQRIQVLRKIVASMVSK